MIDKTSRQDKVASVAAPKLKARKGLFLSSAVLLSLGFGSGVQANCSLNTNIPATINYTNTSSFAVNLIWVDPNCAEQVTRQILPGTSYSQTTFKNDVWRTRKVSDNSLYSETMPIASPATVNIHDPVPPPVSPFPGTTTTTSALVTAAAVAELPPSPANTPFVDPMPIPPTMTAVTTPSPLPTNAPNTGVVPLGRTVNAKLNGVTVASATIGGFSETLRPNHQKWTEFGGSSATLPGFTGKFYESVEMEVPWNFYPAVNNVPASKVWTFVEASTGNIGPLRLNAQYGEPVIHRVHNALPADNGGFGINQTSTHLHNGHTPSESDGGPEQFYDAGKFKDYHYPNVRAGFASNVLTSSLNGKTVKGDVKETLSTMWFHDHREEFTAQNVYKGLLSFYTLFSNDILLDTGNEGTGLRFPSGNYDVPMVFGDKKFDPVTGQLYYDHTNLDGILGDKYTVNGKIQPYFNVQKRKYRFRLLNAGPSRYYDFKLSNNANFVQLTTNGNLLPNRILTSKIRLSPAERSDVIVDFTSIAAGTKIYLQNTLEQLDGAGPTGNTIAPINIVEFRVQAGTVTDTSQIPASTKTLLALPSKTQAVSQNRQFDFGSSSGAWVVNGELYDPNTITVFPKLNAKEKWKLTSGGGWGHPVHLHFEEGQILTRDGNATLIADDVGRKDVYRMGQGVHGSSGSGQIETFYQWRDFLGDYPMHCHNVVHEDHAMMIRYEIVP